MEKVALLDSINPAANQLFEAEGFEVVKFPKLLETSRLADLARENRALGVRSGPPLPHEVFEVGTALEAVGCYCVGTNHVDLQSASAHGVAVFNSLHENTRSVAEHVIGSVFDLMKRTSEHNRFLHDGIWTKTDERTYEVRGKTLGIVGYGAVGSQVSVLAEALGMSVHYFDPNPKFPPYGKARRADSLEQLLSQSDVVTLHVPGGKATKSMISKDTLSIMKSGSYLINTARGDVVDYEAAAAALESGRLYGIAADVFENEPSKRGDRFDHVLTGLGNALLTPHTAGSTSEAQTDIGRKTSAKLIGCLATGSTIGSVNLPELSLSPVAQGATRLLHLHQNAPGVVASVLDRIAEANLNVSAQHLQTREALGYAAIDIEGGIPHDIVEAIAGVDTTLSVRTCS